MSDECKSCGAAIIWIKDQNGTTLPVDKRRVRIYAEGPDAGWHYKEHTLRKDALLYHISHFITCPGATQHSKK